MSQLQPTGRQRKEQVCGSRRHSGLTTPLRVLSGARAAVRTVGRAAMVQANEAAMLMSAAAMIPLRLVGGGFDAASGSSPPVRASPHPRQVPCCSSTGSRAPSQAGPWSPTP